MDFDKLLNLVVDHAADYSRWRFETWTTTPLT